MTTTNNDFKFRVSRHKINWDAIMQTDVEALRRHIDVDSKLESITKNITYADIKGTDLGVDPARFMQYATLVQVILQYLLHSQDYLSKTCHDRGRKLKMIAAERDALATDNRKLKQEVEMLRLEVSGRTTEQTRDKGPHGQQRTNQLSERLRGRQPPPLSGRFQAWTETSATSPTTAPPLTGVQQAATTGGSGGGQSSPNTGAKQYTPKRPVGLYTTPRPQPGGSHAEEEAHRQWLENAQLEQLREELTRERERARKSLTDLLTLREETQRIQQLVNTAVLPEHAAQQPPSQIPPQPTPTPTPAPVPLPQDATSFWDYIHQQLKRLTEDARREERERLFWMELQNREKATTRGTYMVPPHPITTPAGIPTSAATQPPTSAATIPAGLPLSLPVGLAVPQHVQAMFHNSAASSLQPPTSLSSGSSVGVPPTVSDGVSSAATSVYMGEASALTLEPLTARTIETISSNSNNKSVKESETVADSASVSDSPRKKGKKHKKKPKKEKSEEKKERERKREKKRSTKSSSRSQSQSRSVTPPQQIMDMTMKHFTQALTNSPPTSVTSTLLHACDSDQDDQTMSVVSQRLASDINLIEQTKKHEEEVKALLQKKQSIREQLEEEEKGRKERSEMMKKEQDELERQLEERRKQRELEQKKYEEEEEQRRQEERKKRLQDEEEEWVREKQRKEAREQEAEKVKQELEREKERHRLQIEREREAYEQEMRELRERELRDREREREQRERERERELEREREERERREQRDREREKERELDREKERRDREHKEWELEKQKEKEKREAREREWEEREREREHARQIERDKQESSTTTTTTHNHTTRRPSVTFKEDTDGDTNTSKCNNEAAENTSNKSSTGGGGEGMSLLQQYHSSRGNASKTGSAILSGKKATSSATPSSDESEDESAWVSRQNRIREQEQREQERLERLKGREQGAGRRDEPRTIGSGGSTPEPRTIQASTPPPTSPSSDCDEKEEQEDSPKPKRSNVDECKYCGKPVYSGLMVHQATCKERARYCEWCEQKGIASLADHKKTCNFKPVICEFCNNTFPQHEYQDSHYENCDMKDSAFDCDYCGQEFDTEVALGKHFQKCVYKPIACPDCGVPITQKNLKLHQATACKPFISKSKQQTKASSSHPSSSPSTVHEEEEDTVQPPEEEEAPAPPVQERELTEAELEEQELLELERKLSKYNLNC